MQSVFLLESGLDDQPAELAGGGFAFDFEARFIGGNFWKRTETGIGAEGAGFGVGSVFEGYGDRVVLERVVGRLGLVWLEDEQ